MKTLVFFAAALATAGLVGEARATIINVPSGGDVQAAINSAGVSGDEVVLASGNYTGSINISGKSLVLRGASAVSRPVYSFTGTITYGSSTAGMAIRGDGTSVTVQNIIFLPGTTGFTGTPKGIASATLTAGTTQAVTISNCLLAPNDGTNQPLISDPFSNAAITGGWPNDIFYLNNGGFLGLPTGAGTYVVTDSVLIGAGRDGFICYPNSAGSSLTVTGSAVAQSARNGTQWGDDNLTSTAFTVSGTRAKPGLILRNNYRTTASSGPNVDGINGGSTINISRLVFIANPANGSGFIITPANTSTVSVTNSLFASNVGRGLYMGATGTKNPTVLVAQNTFFTNATGLDIVPATPTYTVRDNVFAGPGTGINLGTGVGAKTTLQKNALVTAGAYALTAQTTGEAPASNTGTVTADPAFISVDVSSLSALQTAFNVTNSAYATAGTSAAPLSGWGAVVPPPAAVSNWSLFE